MARLQKRKQAAVTTGSAKTSRPSLRGGLTAYTRSPWGPALLSPLREAQASAHGLSTGRPGPRDFTVASELFVGMNFTRA
jgi:hypothetical protein